MKNILGVFYFVIFLFVDQITKILIMSNFSYSQSKEIISGFFYLTFIKNYGSAFGFFQGRLVMFYIATIIAMFLLYHLYKQMKFKYKNILFAMIFAGVIGNLIDRIRLGYVIDFLHFKFFTHSFYIFNFADVYLSIGILATIIIVLKEEKKYD